MKSIVIAGYYGFKNVGDDAVLTSMLDDLRVVFPGAAFTVVGLDVEQLQNQFGVRGVHWTDFQATWRAVAESDVVLLGGGGIFNDYLEYPDNLLLNPSSNPGSFGLVYGLPLMALVHGKPAMVFAAGASFIKSDFAKRDIGLGVAACSAVTLRDCKSVELLKVLPLLGGKNMEVTADPAFRLKNIQGEQFARVFGKSPTPPGPCLAVVLRQWDFYGNQQVLEKAVAEAINAFCRVHGGWVLLLPFDTRSSDNLDDDVAVLQRVAKALEPTVPYKLLTDYLRPGEASALMGSCDLALCMRLHSAIFATKNAVPLVGLVYDQKVFNVLDSIGLGEYALDIQALNADSLAARLDDLWRQRERHRQVLSAAAQKASEAALGNITRLKQMLEEPYRAPSQKYSPEMTDFFINYTRRCHEFHQNSLADIQHSLANTQNSLADVTYKLAYACHQSKQYAQALEYYQKALTAGFSEFWVRYNRGCLFLETERTHEAKPELSRAVGLDPSHEGARRMLETAEQALCQR